MPNAERDYSLLGQRRDPSNLTLTLKLLKVRKCKVFMSVITEKAIYIRSSADLLYYSRVLHSALYKLPPHGIFYSYDYKTFNIIFSGSRQMMVEVYLETLLSGLYGFFYI